MDQVLSAVSAEVSDVVGGAISFQFDVPLPPSGFAAAVAARGLAREAPVVLVAGVERGGVAVLAEVSFGALGYPANFRWEDQFDSVSDRDSFEAFMKRLLAHAATGKKIAALIQRS